MTARERIEDNPLRKTLLDLYESLSNRIAGGKRVDQRDLRPGVDDPSEGLIPTDFRDQFTNLDWYTPTDWSGLTAEDAVRADLTQIPEPGGKVVSGKGQDFFRSGEAPNNYTNRHNPLYKARTEFVSQITPKLKDMFGIQGEAGHYRKPQASHSDPGGPSANSDHYSAGAVDFFGTPEELDSLRDYLVDQPWVSFVRWRTESHYDHLHMSVDLGWVAQNYFAGRAAPNLPKPSAKPTAPVEATTSAGPSVQISDDPSANQAI